MPNAAILWFLIVGGLLISVALSGSYLRRLPLTTAMLYLVVGVALGPWLLGLLDLHPVDNARTIEIVAEIAVLISLFTAGLKLRVPFPDRRWLTPLRLATVSMAATIVLVALVGTIGLGLPLGAAILLGAILAPTDPVLASDVQVEHPYDRDRVRFGLTGEAGLNDGVAFPFVMLGLGLLGLHELGDFGWRWFTVDLVWAVAGGLAIGAGVGWVVPHLVLRVRGTRDPAHGFDDFLTLGLIGLTYGVALAAHTYGFLAVFAAGLALRGIERQEATEQMPADGMAPPLDGTDTPPPALPADNSPATPTGLAEAVLTFNEKIERLAEVVIVVIVGSLLAVTPMPGAAFWFVPLLLLVIRPLAVWLGLYGARVSPTERRLMAWFGVRGIGSVYYLAYAASHGLDAPTAELLAGLTLTVVTTSIVVHGISVTPIMRWYSQRARRRRPAAPAALPD